MDTLYLTAHEKELIQSLPAELQVSFELEELEAYETEEQLDIRMTMLAERDHLTLHEFLDGFRSAMEQEAEIDLSFMQRFPNALIPELLFAMGAIGISAIIECVLPDAQTERHIEGVAALSSFRHRILEANAAALPVI